MQTGGFLDEDHYSYFLPDRIMKELRDNIGKPWAPLKLDQGLLGGLPVARYNVLYVVNLPVGITQDPLERIGLGIYLDFQVGYEQAQSWDPRTLFSAGSSFSNEDLPTDYLSFVGYVKRKTFEQVVDLLGGGYEYTYKPKGYSFGELECAINKCDCDSNNPHNRDVRLKVWNGAAFEYLPYPEELTMSPIGPGEYWLAERNRFNVNRSP